jgi:hypothetical protein
MDEYYYQLKLMHLFLLHPVYLGIFIQRLNPRTKALEPNPNKNAQIQLVKLSKAKMFK